jgi:hypothetical protein
MTINTTDTLSQITISNISLEYDIARVRRYLRSTDPRPSYNWLMWCIAK